jgi:hypothetical protein
MKCGVCGRDFPTIQALGGHVKNTHNQEPEKDAVAPGNGTVQDPAGLLAPGEVHEVTEAAEVPKTEEPSLAEQIRGYLTQGYSLNQLKDIFGFKETTIRQEIEKMVLPEGNEFVKKNDPRDDGLPVTRKMGGGMEVTTPEAVLRRYMDGGEHEQWELRGMMKLRAAMLMVMDLVNIQKAAAEADAKRLEPVLRLMKETREEQDAAAARAKSSSYEMAREAAHEAVDGVLGYMEEKLPKAPPPKTIDDAYGKRMDKVMDMVWGMMEQQMFPNRQTGAVPEGWETEQKKGGV